MQDSKSMAVRALEGDGDTISRQQAIEAFEPTHYIDWYTPTIIETLEALPSAQPETHDKRTETHECDLISRQQAIDGVVRAMIDGADAELVEVSRKAFKAEIDLMPDCEFKQVILDHFDELTE